MTLVFTIFDQYTPKENEKLQSAFSEFLKKI